jgi:hypothetical protein
MKNCIYCRAEVPTDVPREHVIPQSFGVFEPDLTLGCVCSPCNGYLGSKLEWPMRIESIEGARRLQFGHKGTVGGIGTKGVVPIVGEGHDWKGARTAIKTDKNGTQSTVVLPQIGARRTPEEPFEWVLEKDLNADFAARYPKGSRFHIVGGDGPEHQQRLVEKLKAVCPTFIYGGSLQSPITENGTVMVSVDDYTVSRTVARCLCKIAFNYMALTCGDVFPLSSEFNALREFIRNNIGDAAGRVIVKQKPIIAQGIITGERGTDGHVLTIEGRPRDRTFTVQLALFNSIPYRIPMTDQYIGHAYVKGHHFSNDTNAVSELQAKFAGPDFDPSKITW